MKAEGGQSCITTVVATWVIAASMDFTVDLDRQSCRQTGEIEAVCVDRMLAAKFKSAGPCTQNAPQNHFGQIATATLAAGHIDDGALRGEDPSTIRLRRTVPLPVPGRYWRHTLPPHIRNTPKRAPSAIGAFSDAASARPSTSRVCGGSMMPSSHNRAVA